jgi:hypothetical protein
MNHYQILITYYDSDGNKQTYRNAVVARYQRGAIDLAYQFNVCTNPGNTIISVQAFI